MSRPVLSLAQEDYLETIYRLTLEAQGAERTPRTLPGVRVTDIAQALGTKLPTVVRTVGRLREQGLVDQEQRGLVHLTPLGRRTGEQLTHRHSDAAYLLYAVLGVPPRRAETEACVIEHGFSADTAQRLHQFLDAWDALAPAQRERLSLRGKRLARDFTLLGEASASGGRG